MGLNRFRAYWQGSVGFLFIEADSNRENSAQEGRIRENITFRVLIGSETVHGTLEAAGPVSGLPSGNGTRWKGTVKVQQLGTYILAVYRGRRQLPNSPFRWNHLYFPVPSWSMLMLSFNMNGLCRLSSVDGHSTYKYRKDSS
jgi:hypothetical protein